MLLPRKKENTREWMRGTGAAARSGGGLPHCRRGEELQFLTRQVLEGVTVIEADAKPACAVHAAGGGAWVRGMRGRVRGSQAGVVGGRCGRACGWMRGLCSCVCGACAVTWGGVAQAPGLATVP